MERKRLSHLFFNAALLGVLCLGGCRKQGTEHAAAPLSTEAPAATNTPSASTAATPSSHAPAQMPRPSGRDAPPAELWKLFSGQKAFENVQQQVNVGPRPSGTPEAETARALIETRLKAAGWDAIRQEFTADTPRGPMKFVNVIGRYSATGTHPAPSVTQQAILCSHYDTKRFTFIKFLGACDGGSSTGALLELARTLALDPPLAAKIELVFFDGEEAMVQFTSPEAPAKENDGLWGSRHYADDLQAGGRARQFKFGVLWDMIGDKDFKITLSPDSPPELAKGIFDAAEGLGMRGGFRYFDRDILDDHKHLQRVRIPAIDLIDFDIRYWHTADDTIDKLTPESLQKVGEVTLSFLQKALK